LPEEEEAPAEENNWFEGLRGGEEGDSRRMQWFKFLFPIMMVLAVAGILLVVLPWGRFVDWGEKAFLYLIPPAGKESIIPWGIAEGFHPLAMAGTVLLMDFVCALFIAWNYPLAKRIPILGRYIAYVEKVGSKKLEGNPALKAGAWIGMVLFVMVPFQGSGGITASIIGRAVGMVPKFVVSAVAVGALLAGVIIAYLAEISKMLLEYNFYLGLIAILLVALALVLSLLAFRLVRIRQWEREETA
jgi:uncharacterized membrane protein